MSHIRMSHVTHMKGWVLILMSMSHVTHMKESCAVDFEVLHASLMNYSNESCHTHMNESFYTYECVMSHIRMGLSHVKHMNESCHAFEWVMSRIWMSHVTHMNESCHAFEWVMSHVWVVSCVSIFRYFSSCRSTHILKWWVVSPHSDSYSASDE